MPGESLTVRIFPPFFSLLGPKMGERVEPGQDMSDSLVRYAELWYALPPSSLLGLIGE